MQRVHRFYDEHAVWWVGSRCVAVLTTGCQQQRALVVFSAGVVVLFPHWCWKM
jgi:hypothetical protein